MKQLPFLSLVLLSLFACGNPNPGRDRNELFTQSEESDQTRGKTLHKISDGYMAPPGIKYSPEYTNTSGMIRLDILKELEHPVDYPLSRLGKQVEYRKMEAHKYASVDKLIPVEEGYIYKDMYGLVLVDHSLQQGKRLIKQHVEITNIQGMTISHQKEDIRSVFYQPSTRSLKCFFRYEDPENPRDYKYYMGDVLLDELLSAKDTCGIEQIINRIPIGHAAGMWPVQDGFAFFRRYEDGLYTLSERGDTLCYFLPGDPEPLNLKGTIRGAESSDIYEFEEGLTFRLAYTDTVFRVVDSHTFEPVYKIDLGPYQVSRKDGFSVAVSLEEKYLVHNLYETPDKLFIRISKNYDCPNTRNDKTIFFHQFVYDKPSGNLVCFEHADNLHVPGLLKNDLDKGPDFWPAFLFEGSPACKFSAKDITDPKQRDWIQQQMGSDELNEDDILFMIIR